MPTPIHAFTRIAARIGGVDPADTEAVQRWFVESFPRLRRRRIEEILTELLAADGDPATEVPEPIYPRDVSLPRLDDSPAAEFRSRWRAWLAALRTRWLSHDR